MTKHDSAEHSAQRLRPARSAREAASGDQFRARPAAQVLADRLAVALVHHEPGWRLPRPGVPGLRSRIDPMAGELTCRSHRTSWRRVPENIGWALHVDPAEQGSRILHRRAT